MEDGEDARHSRGLEGADADFVKGLAVEAENPKAQKNDE